jgi:YjgF/chorismate_mutase-like, putative endoribonuclease
LNSFLRKLVNIPVYDNLKKYGITLPAVTAPVAAFVPHVQTGNLIFVTGHIAKKDGKPWVGQLGAQLNTEQGKEAARGIAADLIATRNSAAGDLNKISRIKLMILVNSTRSLRNNTLLPMARLCRSSNFSALLALTVEVPMGSHKCPSAPV